MPCGANTETVSLASVCADSANTSSAKGGEAANAGVVSIGASIGTSICVAIGVSTDGASQKLGELKNIGVDISGVAGGIGACGIDVGACAVSVAKRVSAMKGRTSATTEDISSVSGVIAIGRCISLVGGGVIGMGKGISLVGGGVICIGWGISLTDGGVICIGIGISFVGGGIIGIIGGISLIGGGVISIFIGKGISLARGIISTCGITFACGLACACCTICLPTSKLRIDMIKFHVVWLAMPFCVMPNSRWNACTEPWVIGPKMPSTLRRVMVG